MAELTRDALAVVGAFTMVCAAALFVYILAVHVRETRREMQATRAAGEAHKALVSKGREAAQAPPYGNPSVRVRTFDDWLAEVDLEKVGRHAHNN